MRSSSRDESFFGLEWTFFALTDTLSTLAYFSARFPQHTDQSSSHAELPKDWWLTLTIVREGLKAGWNGLDKLTIGIVVTTVLVHYLKRTPLPTWENLIHITNKKKYTAFTYSFVHVDWGHVCTNVFFLARFLPDLKRYFDGDTFRAAAFWASLALITPSFTILLFPFCMSVGHSNKFGVEWCHSQPPLAPTA